MKAFFKNTSRAIFVGLMLISLIPVASFTQQWVSTNVEKRNVILEEFTGIHCVYCPDGHRIANEMVANYPGKVFLINIHAGGYAAPGAGEPDYRVPVGVAIDAAAGVTGYPAGSVNRSTTPWAMSRGSWNSVANNIMSQNSPVNVAVKSSVDLETRKLTTVVEVYYTSTISVDNYLTIFLTQDNMLGPQTDGGFNPTNWVNGKYKHNHVLRMAVTGGASWGEKLTATTSGTFFTKTYVTDIPEAITNLGVDLTNLNIVAFVSENRNNIYSGSGVEVEFNKDLFVDLGMKSITTFPQSVKFTSLNPKIEVTNNSGKPVTNFDVNVSINGIITTKTYTGTLESNVKTVVDFGNVDFEPQGYNTLVFSGFTNINGNPSIVDMDFNNNNLAFAFVAFKAKAFTQYLAGFNAELPKNLIIDNSQNVKCVISSTIIQTNHGANSTKSAVLFYLHSSWGLSGKPGNIIFGEADLTKSSSSKVAYYYAYSDGGQNGTAPTIRTQVSEDFGVTWVELNTTTCMSTGTPSNPNNLYVPVTSEYKKVELSLDAYNGKSLLIKVSGIPGTSGNAMYIDEISVTTSAVAEGPKISVDTKTVAFGTVDTDKSKDMEVTLTNTGDETLTVYSILKQGDNNNAFTFTSGSDTKSILKGATAKIGIRFQPMSGADYSGTIAISTNAKNEPSLNISLTGKGNPAGSVAYGVTPNGALSMTMTPNPVVESSQFNYRGSL